MYAGVPSRAAALETLERSPRSLATPKSSRITRSVSLPGSRARKMLSGLRSRWTMPSAWAALSAEAAGPMMATASAVDSRPRRARPLAQRLALQVLHQEVGQPVAQAAHVDDVDDVAVADGVDGAGLVLKRAIISPSSANARRRTLMAARGR